MNILEKINEKIKKHINEKSTFPTKLYLTAKEKNEFIELKEINIGNLISDIIKLGPQKAFENKGNKLFNLKIYWDADEFKVE